MEAFIVHFLTNQCAKTALLLAVFPRVLNGCAYPPAVQTITQTNTDGKGQSGKWAREIGNSATTADHGQLTLRTTTILEWREDIAYLPNDPLPFTGVFQKFYASGKKEQETNYQDGKLNGLDTL